MLKGERQATPVRERVGSSHCVPLVATLSSLLRRWQEKDHSSVIDLIGPMPSDLIFAEKLRESANRVTDVSATSLDKDWQRSGQHAESKRISMAQKPRKHANVSVPIFQTGPGIVLSVAKEN